MSPPSASHDVIGREEHSSSSKETADVHSGHTSGELLSQRNGQSEKDGSTQRLSGRKRKRHAVIGPMLPPKKTTEQQDNAEQTKVRLLVIVSHS